MVQWLGLGTLWRAQVQSLVGDYVPASHVPKEQNKKKKQNQNKSEAPDYADWSPRGGCLREAGVPGAFLGGPCPGPGPAGAGGRPGTHAACF